jgi:coenzyme F420 hydrogenase subunit beta
VLHPGSIQEVVENGLCIGCGLCEALTDSLSMKLTERGVLRPQGTLRRDEEIQLLSACPGAVAASHIETGSQMDEVWGPWQKLVMAWSAEPDVRFQASTGGVLTALGRYALDAGFAEFVLHAGVHATDPLRTDWVISDTADEVLNNSGSRYGPVSVLAGLKAALARNAPFVLIAKPCARLLATSDTRMANNCVAMLTMVCGGLSDLTKTREAVAGAGIAEKDVAEFRYRGFGTPGPHRITLKNGRYIDIDYNSMWSRDEQGWRIQQRCKICADPIGEAADVAVSDTWPGGKPVADDPGHNGLIIRTGRGADLVQAATEAGFLTTAETLDARQFDEWQPHNVRKKRAIQPRCLGLDDQGQPSPEWRGLRVPELAENLESFSREREGTAQRAANGAFREDSKLQLIDTSVED